MFDPRYREPLFDDPRRVVSVNDFIDSNIGAEFHQCRVNKIPNYAPYKNDVMNYVNNIKQNEKNGIGLILHGDYGTGKTGTAVAVCAEAIKRSGRAWFISSWDIEETFRHSIGWRESAQHCAKNMQFLILDDVGVTSRKNRDTVENTIAMLVRTRSNKKLPTLITTNMSIEKLFSNYQSLQRVFVSKYKDIEIVGTDWVEEARS